MNAKGGNWVKEENLWSGGKKKDHLEQSMLRDVWKSMIQIITCGALTITLYAKFLNCFRIRTTKSNI